MNLTLANKEQLIIMLFIYCNYILIRYSVGFLLSFPDFVKVELVFNLILLFELQATGDVEQILWENTNRRTMSSALYKVQLWPCIKLTNALPIPVSLEPPGTLTSSVLMPGTSIQLTKARLGSMYLELQVLFVIYSTFV